MTPALRIRTGTGGIRLAMLATSVALHGLAFAAFIPASVEDAPFESLELSLAPPQGETMAEEKDAVDSSAQSEAAAAADTPPPPPVDQPQVQEAAKIPDPDAQTFSAAQLPDVPPPEPVARELPPEAKPPEPQAVAQSQASQATDETFAARAVGVESGLRVGGGATRAAYAAAVKKELARRKRRPDADAHGTVSVSFLIGPNGAPISIDVDRRTHPALADAARSIVASVQLPPPPGGAFAATVAIKFE